MGAFSSDNTQVVVENVSTFRRNPSTIMPEISQKRKITDASFLISFVICVVILLSLTGYTLFHSDIQRIVHGYDYCGNVCGSKNSFVEGISCSGKDMSDKPYRLINETYQDPICVETCEHDYGNGNDYVDNFYRCSTYWDNEDLELYADNLKKLDRDSTNLIILCVVGLCLSVLALGFFRYFVTTFVWTMLIISILMMFGLSGLYWYLYSHSSGNQALLVSAIAFTVISVIFALCILVLTQRIKLITFFFNEAIKIVFAMPLLLLEPVLTFISNFIVLSLFMYISLLIISYGTLEPYDPGTYHYVSNNTAVSFALWWNIIMMLWMVQFVLACQQMVISGAVATYYFTRDKLTVVSPIYNSFYNLIRYHLGTVAFGSFIITAITVIKLTINAMSRQNNWLRLLHICLRPLEDLLKYMTSMGYIVTAIHGQPLCRSSVRAINLIVSNFLSAIVMNSVGNFVFFMIKLTIVVIVIGIGLLMDLAVVTIVFGSIVTLLFIHCIFVVFEIAVDTVFICYCEDQCVNDGADNPFLTSIELHEQIKKAQWITQQIELAKKKK